MTDYDAYDAIIIGSGQGGNPLAVALAEQGRKTALIERSHVGGSCINFGCTPTKTMIASARIAHLARRSAEFGVHTGSVTVDLAAVRQRKRDMVESFRQGTLNRLESSGLDLLRGEARFFEPRGVEVHLHSGEIRRLRAETIVIDTGSRAAHPPIEGLDQVPILHEDTLMELDHLPDHLVILGGGYLGVEFGQMFRRFGSPVTIIQRSAYLLNREDPDIADELAQILRDEGITLLLNSSARCVERTTDGRIQVTASGPEGDQLVSGSHLLVAVGRTPNVEALNLAAAGVATNEKGYIKVNDRLETSAPGVYAIGDVNGGPAFTHISYDDFRILRTNLLEGGSASVKDRLLPYTVFTDPQLGRVGLSEQQARQQGRRVRVGKMLMTRIARANEMGETRGLVKAVVDAESDQILGAAVLGAEGGELMAVLQVAIMGKLPYTALRDGVFAHPTLAEGLNNLFAQLEDSQ